MKTNKIIVIFIVIIIAMSGGFFAYKHNQKVNLAQYYYNIGDYQKASDLKVNNISDKSKMLNIAKNWRNDLNDDENLYITIMLISSEINLNKKVDISYVNKLEIYYKGIGNYFKISTNRLDDIGKMNSEDGTLAVKNLR